MKDITQQLADALLKIEAGLAAGLDCSRACKLNTHYHERVLGEAVAAVQAIKAAHAAQPQEDVAKLKAEIARLKAEHDRCLSEQVIELADLAGEIATLHARIAQLKAEVERLRGELNGRCEHCGSNKIGPCAHCGAPQCCYKCCEIDALRARIAELESGWVRVEERLPDVRYQLLKEGVTILPTDEILRDDCKTWEAIGNAWPIGYSFSHSFFVPIRRPLPAPPQEEAK